MRRALVTGAAGLLGRHIAARLVADFAVTGVDIAPNPFAENSIASYVSADLSVPGRLREIADGLRPDLVVNCAAYTDVDGCERNHALADRLNVGLVEELLDSAAGKIVHFSTDYVFDGRNGPYDEDDPTCPIGYYGVTKLRSEEKLLESGADVLIVRSNVLFGAIPGVRPNYVTWLIDSLRAGKHLSIVTDQFNNPIHAEHLAEAVIAAARVDLRGVWHIAGRDYLSRHEIALRVAGFFGLDAGLIASTTTAQLGQTAPRPLRGGLKTDRIAAALGRPMPGFEDGLRLMASY